MALERRDQLARVDQVLHQRAAAERDAVAGDRRRDDLLVAGERKACRRAAGRRRRLDLQPGLPVQPGMAARRDRRTAAARGCSGRPACAAASSFSSFGLHTGNTRSPKSRTAFGPASEAGPWRSAMSSPSRSRSCTRVSAVMRTSTPGCSRVKPARRGISHSAANELVVVTESGRRLPACARSRSVAARMVVMHLRRDGVELLPGVGQRERAVAALEQRARRAGLPAP